MAFDLLKFSPDLDLTTSDDGKGVVSIVSGGAMVFSATHIPYQRNIIVHDIRSVVEYYMRQGSHALRSFTLRAKHNGSTLIFDIELLAIN